VSRLTDSKNIENALTRAGLRRTPQRVAILEYLLRNPVHATAEELWPALNRRGARASRATVYNTLHSLVEAGLVREFRLDGSASRYDAFLHPHHHFVCDRCGGVEDLDWFDIPALSRTRPAARRIRSWEVVVRGECASCR
jgi:Fur family peroxide stress response transcriptional regulator